MYKKYQIFSLFFAVLALVSFSDVSCMHFGLRCEPKSLASVHKLEYLKEYASNLLKHENDFNNVDISHKIYQRDLCMQFIKELGTGFVIFKVPDKNVLKLLTKEQATQARALLKVYKKEKVGKYYIIIFDCDDINLLPQNREEAALLLLAPYLKNVARVPQEVEVPLNEYQRLSISEKNKENVEQPLHSQYIENSVQEQIHRLTVTDQHNDLKRKRTSELESSHSISNARELLTTLGVNLSQNISEEHLHFKETVLNSIDHYIMLLNRSSTVAQQLLFGSVISALAQIYDSTIFQNADNNTFNAFRNMCGGDEFKFAKLAKLGHILIAMGLSVELIHTAIGCIHEVMVLAQMLVDIAISVGKEKVAQIKNWVERINQKITSKYVHIKNMQLVQMTFGNLTPGQISTLITNEFLKSIQTTDQQLVSPNNVSITFETFYIDFFKRAFKSDHVMKDDGTIYEIHEYMDVISKQIERCARQEGFSYDTLVKTILNIYKKIGELQIGDFVACFNFETQQEEYRKIIYIGEELLLKCIQFTGDNLSFYAAPDQEFYIESMQRLVTAQEMKDNPDLAHAYFPAVQKIREMNEPMRVIKMTVEGNHNFYVTHHNILTHNFTEAFAIPLLGPAGPVLLLGFGIFVGYHLMNKHENMQRYDYQQPVVPVQNTNPQSVNQTPGVASNQPGMTNCGNNTFTPPVVVYPALIPSQPLIVPTHGQQQAQQLSHNADAMQTSYHHSLNMPYTVPAQNNHNQHAMQNVAAAGAIVFCAQCLKQANSYRPLNINKALAAPPIDQILPRDPAIRQRFETQYARLMSTLCMAIIQAISNNQPLDVTVLKNSYHLEGLSPEIQNNLNATLNTLLDQLSSAANHFSPGSMDYANRLPCTAYMLGQYSYYLNPDLYRDLLKQYQATDYKGFAYYFERATWSELHGELDNIGQGVKELATDFCQCVRGATKSVVNLFTPSKATKAQGPDHASHHAQSEEPAHKKARHAEQCTEQTALHCGAQFEKNIESSTGVCGTAINQDTIPIPAACTPDTDMTDTQGICAEQTVDIPIPGPCMEVPETPKWTCQVINQPGSIDPATEPVVQSVPSNIPEATVVQPQEKKIISVESELADKPGFGRIVYEHNGQHVIEFQVKKDTEKWLEILGSSEKLKQLEEIIKELRKTTSDHRYGNIDDSDISVEKYQKLEKIAEEEYKALRLNNEDIKQIASNTGIPLELLQEIKNHVFLREHILMGEEIFYIVSVFPADLNMLAAWKRLIDGSFVQSDLLLLLHEYAESLIVQETKVYYKSVHDIINEFYNWNSYIRGR